MRQFDNVNCSRGAPMGRSEYCEEDARRVYVFRVRLSGDYDDGGAYWGSGMPLWCARDARHADRVQLFTRAVDRADAVAHFLRLYPQLRVVNKKPRINSGESFYE